VRDQRDPVGETRLLVEGARAAYDLLADPEQLLPTRGSRRDQNGGTTRRSKAPAAPAPVDLDVLDYLIHAEEEVFGALYRVLGFLGVYADPPPIEGTTYPKRRRIPADVGGALDAISEALPQVPAEVGAETAAVMWKLSQGGARLLGTDATDVPRWPCPSCGRRSATTRPNSQGLEAVCMHRACRKTFPIGQAATAAEMVS
jgi:hypothetical protein